MAWSWVGAYNALKDIEDKQQRKEEMLLQLREQRRNVLLPYLMDEYKINIAAQQQAAAEQRFLQRRGLSTESIELLESSGQVSMVVEAFEAAGNKLNTRYVQELDSYIRDQVEDGNQLANALITSTDYDQNTEEGRALSLVDIFDRMYETKDPEEEARSILNQLVTLGGPSGPTQQPIDLNFSGIEGLSEAAYNNIRKNVSESVARLTGGEGWQRAADGSYYYNGNDPKMGAVLSTFESRVADLMLGLGGRDLATAMDEVFNPYQQKMGGDAYFGIKDLYEDITTEERTGKDPYITNATPPSNENPSPPLTPKPTTSTQDEEEEDFWSKNYLNGGRM